MITILFIIFAVASFYCKAKKENMSKFKWAVVGLLISVVPMAGLPVILNNIARKSVGGLGIMAGVACVIFLSAVLQKQIKK
ncbi:hypothetical protein GCAAIG_12380 [Candidatus Electronema halotolerans]